MEKRALVAEERAAEAVVVERKARAELDAREKQMASMRLRVSEVLHIFLGHCQSYRMPYLYMTFETHTAPLTDTIPAS